MKMNVKSNDDIIEKYAMKVEKNKLRYMSLAQFCMLQAGLNTLINQENYIYILKTASAANTVHIVFRILRAQNYTLIILNPY